ATASPTDSTLPYNHSSFFFYCSLPHRNLHSFPTRRSSDLHFVQRGLATVNHFRIVTVLGQRRGDLPGNRNFIFNNQDPHGCIGKDRKSTRLNSSHVASSYAVFCLKKKNRSGCDWTGKCV